MDRKVVLDTETTGLSAAQGHRMVEIGCVEMIDGSRTGECFHVYINPERDVPEEVVKIHGLTFEFLQDKPTFKEIVDEFLTFIGESKLVIHNASFDMGFINYQLQLEKKKQLSMERVIDTLKIARTKYPGAKNNLDALCNRFNVDLSKREKHGALLDSELLAEVYQGLVGGKQRGLALDKQSNRHETTNVSREKIVRPARKFAVLQEELEAHKTFIASFSPTLWENES